MRLPPPRADWALFLDFDGTLVSIADEPMAVSIPRRLLQLLERTTATLNGALALVSGRPIAQLDRLLAPLVLPAAGLHGLELRLPDGSLRRVDDATAAVAEARQRLTEFATAHPTVMLEDKGQGLVLHYRRAPELAAACRAAAEAAVAASAGELVLLPGKMVLELKPDGTDKGRVIDELRRLAPFSERRPVFIGDDVTDEAGFAAVNAAGGISVRVGDDTATKARHRLADVADVLDWLERFPPPQAGSRHWNT